MAEKYDVIVIGAGLGGLSAATFLAKNGMRVLLCERHNVPGGYASSFVRGRYEFEVALHELSGIGPEGRRGPLYRYLDHLGVAEKVEFLQMPNMYRSVFPGLDVTLPVGREKLEETLCQAFPGESAGIRTFLKRVFDLGRELGKLQKEGLGAVFSPSSLLQFPRRYPNTFRYQFATWGDVLNRDVTDPRVQAVLSQSWGYYGLPPSQIAFVYFASALYAYATLGPSFPRGRSQALSTAFIRRFEELGGEVRFRCAAQRIPTRNGRVAGVVLESGEQIAADWVVSNTDPITTCRDLIREDIVPRDFFQSLQSSEVAMSTFNVYLGVACPHEELGIDEHEIFLNADFSIEDQFRKARSIEPPGGIVLTTYNVVYPEISPPGTSVVVLTGLQDGEPWYAVEPDRYVETKNSVADAMIRMADGFAPGLRENAEVVEVSTPLTNMRYAATLGGSIYGFSNTTRNHTVWRMACRGPVEGLYFVGAWTQPGGGFEPTMMSGEMAGHAILGRVQKRREVA